MCVVSMVVKGAQEQWGQIQHWPYPVVTDLSEVIKKLAEIDKKLGAKDCHDPTKDEFLKQLADRITALEKLAASGV